MLFSRFAATACFVIFGFVSSLSLAADSREVPQLEWHDDYVEAMTAAEREGRMMLCYFRDTTLTPQCEQFERAALKRADVRRELSDYVLLRLPLDASISVDGEPVTLIEHAAFGGLNRGAGLAIVDFSDEDSEHYQHVVSVLPLERGRYYNFRPEHLKVALELPEGTLTQRTMMFAVRIHPESPASTEGQLDTTLADEAESHSRHQANINVQGHHNWGHRFQRISARLPGGLMAQEVVAESWPNETLMDAAVDCVASWRQSSGHWGAVRRHQPRFGYDIRRGSNGIWYATGIFGNRG